MTAVSFPCICYNINVYALKTPSKGSLAAPWIAEHVKVHEAFLFNVAMPMSILRVRSRDGFTTLGVRSGCIVTDLKHTILWFRSPVRCVLLTHRGPNLDNVTIVTTTITSTVPSPNCKGTAWNTQPTGFLPRRLEYAANRVLAATLQIHHRRVGNNDGGLLTFRQIWCQIWIHCDSVAKWSKASLALDARHLGLLNAICEIYHFSTKP